MVVSNKEAVLHHSHCRVMLAVPRGGHRREHSLQKIQSRGCFAAPIDDDKKEDAERAFSLLDSFIWLIPSVPLSSCQKQVSRSDVSDQPITEHRLGLHTTTNLRWRSSPSRPLPVSKYNQNIHGGPDARRDHDGFCNLNLTEPNSVCNH